MHRSLATFLIFAFFCLPGFSSDDPWIPPYLGQLTQSSVEIRWEQIEAQNTFLLYGESHRFPSFIAKAKRLPLHTRTPKGHELFAVKIEGLKPNTQYAYQLKSEDFESELYRFKTPNPNANSFSFAIYSDTQRNPDVHKRVAESVLRDGKSKFVLIPGDLVHVGGEYNEYRNKFFHPAVNLLATIPAYPAVGNHEYQGLNDGEAPIYLNYFSLPENGSEEYEGHWYSFDYQNSKVISLNTNFGAQTKFKWHPDMFDAKAAAQQMAFLEKELQGFCKDKGMDFVFVFFHHPNVAELWSVGGEQYSQQIVERMETAVNRCHKAGAVFNGHMHGYAKGQSKDAPLYWITAASGGGYLDYWGEYENEDSPNIQKSIPSFGYVQVEVQRNPARFYVKRYTVGNDLKSLHAPKIEDAFEYRSDNKKPQKPVLHFVDGKVVQTKFRDPDGDRHLETEWQLFDVSGKLLKSLWLRFENVYNETTQKLGVQLVEFDLNDKTIHDVKIRTRHRDSSLGWSDWSEKLKAQEPGFE